MSVSCQQILSGQKWVESEVFRKIIKLRLKFQNEYTTEKDMSQTQCPQNIPQLNRQYNNAIAQLLGWFQ